jgi:RND superfamily putative drug exporter
LLGLATPAAGDLNAAQDNSSAAYAAPDAESTQVETVLAGQRQAPQTAVVVYERRAGITDADQARATTDAAAFAAVPGVLAGVDGPRLSTDGMSLRTIVPIASGADGWDQIAAPVTAIRTLLGPAGSGLVIHVTGPAAVIADTSAAFTGLDSTLLYTTLAIVIAILLLTYRSPVLWLLPIVCVGAALMLAQALVDVLARHAGLTVNGQSASILTVLVFGAGTDYALLLTARYREELRRHPDRRDAMAAALRRALPAIVASAATVMAAMLCLMVARTASTRGMGPVAAIAVGCALISVVTLLPALLVVLGRWVFWPVIPLSGTVDPAARGPWAVLGARLARRPRAAWLATVAVLAGLASGLLGFTADGITADEAFIRPPDSVVGARVLAAHFPAGAGEPVVVLTTPARATAVSDALAAVAGVAAIAPPVDVGDHALIEVTLNETADSRAAREDVRRVRELAHHVDPDALVGGQTAALIDTNEAAAHDRNRIVPLVLLVVLAILVLLLRSVVAPLMLVATVVLSFAAALGASALLFHHVLHWRGADSSLPLFVFVFLVALGVDYNIFLASRIREEAVAVGDTRVAVRTALAATGGVITSAGVVLAGTFAALAALPLIAYAEIGVAVAVGVLMDAIVVRAVLVTAVTLDLGRWTWWPSRLDLPPVYGASATGPRQCSRV